MKWWYILLIVSIFLVLLLGYGTFLFLKIKEKKYIQKYKDNNSENILNQEQMNLLNLNIIEKIKTNSWVLEDIYFIIDTISKNNYKDNLFLEKDGLIALLAQEHLSDSNSFLEQKFLNNQQFEKYINEIQILNNYSKIKKILLEKNIENWDFIFINDYDLNLDINDLFDNIYKKLKKGGMIIFKDIQNKKEKKALISHLKWSSIRHEELIIKSSFILIVK